MKKMSFLLALLPAIFCCNIRAQQADVRLAGLMEQDDWFVINDEYPSLSENVETAYLKDYAEAMLAHYFGSDEAGADKLAKLVEDHKATLGPDACLWLMQWVMFDYELSGDYAAAARTVRQMMDGIRAGDLPGDTAVASQSLRRLESLAAFPAPQVVLPEGRDAVVPYSLAGPVTDLFDGWHIETGDSVMFVPVSHSGRKASFVLDTSAGYSFVTSNLAKRLGIEVLDGVEYAPGFGVAVVDELVVGDDIKFSNAVILVGDIKDEDGNEGVDARLGMDFLRRVPEMQIDTKEHKLIFPAKESPVPDYGANLKKDQWGVRLRVADSLGPINARLATCYRDVAFEPSYCNKRAKEFADCPRKKNVPRGDGSGRVYEDAIEAGDILLETCGTTVRFDNVLLPTTGTTHQPQSDEVLLGMGFINKFDKVTINMRDKFIAVE